MQVQSYKVTKRQKVSDSILNKFPSITYSAVRKLMRNKDIKINGHRISSDVVVEVDDEVLFYISEIPQNSLDVIYEDDNLIIVFKPRKIETVSETDDDLFLAVKNYLNKDCFAVHRLDRNTEGLVVFAKNINSKNELDDAFKNRTIDKFYLALVYGNTLKKSDKLIAYLKKDSKKSVVDIVDNKIIGYEKIQTNYKLLKTIDDTSLVEVELVTGKTHQIRAHFAHIGHFVIGDEKYGDSNINKKFKKKYQCLCAYKIIFHFAENSCLKYLNSKTIELDKSKIDFCQNL